MVKKTPLTHRKARQPLLQFRERISDNREPMLVVRAATRSRPAHGSGVQVRFVRAEEHRPSLGLRLQRLGSACTYRKHEDRVWAGGAVGLRRRLFYCSRFCVLLIRFLTRKATISHCKASTAFLKLEMLFLNFANKFDLRGLEF